MGKSKRIFSLFLFVACVCGALLISPPKSKGDDVPPQELAHLPKPDEHPRIWVGNIVLTSVVPLLDGNLCPSNAACIFGGGVGVRGELELRWPNQFSLGAAYDAWFIDGNGVYRLSTLQAILLTARYVWDTGTRADPYLAGRIGPTLFGDTMRADTFGGAADIEIGVELELTESLSVNLGVSWRTWMTQSFVTEADRVVRSEGQDVAGALTFHAGVTIFESH